MIGPLRRGTFPTLSLRTKLVLSYLAVALGAVAVLAFVVVITVQNYFFNQQVDQLRYQVSVMTQYVEQNYNDGGRSWDHLVFKPFYSPYLIKIVDSQGKVLFCSPAAETDPNACNSTLIDQGLSSALQGQERYGQFQQAPNDDGESGLYISEPLHDQLTHQVIGAVFMASPLAHNRGFSPDQFLLSVNQAILLAGLAIGFIVIVLTLLLARRLTRPLESLTVAAEYLREGDYTRRVEPPRSLDEMGQLAQTFNSMAERIETDIGELRDQDRQRRDLIANIAHDMATPLTAIQGFSEALADEVIHQPEARLETAQLIAREIQRLRRLVADMQQMTSMEQGSTQLDLAPLDLQVLVDETLAVIEPECEQAQISLHNEIAPTTPLVLADSDRVTQVLLNLIDNARRHTPAGGSITVGAYPEGKQLVTWIRDTGEGVDPRDLPHIFERFYRADRSRTGTNVSRKSGSGLGLSIVKAIVSAHTGSIRAESTPGQGTTIIFSLPLAPVKA